MPRPRGQELVRPMVERLLARQVDWQQGFLRASG